MAKRRASTGSKRIKTRHKKTSQTRKFTTPSINPAIRNINKVITDQLNKNNKIVPQTNNLAQNTIQLQAMTVDNFKKLTGNTEKKQKMGKLSIDDGLYLQKLVKRWGTNYARMAQDIKLNRLQWTAQQIERKHETYKKLFPQQIQKCQQ